MSRCGVSRDIVPNSLVAWYIGGLIGMSAGSISAPRHGVPDLVLMGPPVAFGPPPKPGRRGGCVNRAARVSTLLPQSLPSPSITTQQLDVLRWVASKRFAYTCDTAFLDVGAKHKTTHLFPISILRLVPSMYCEQEANTSGAIKLNRVFHTA